jgi:hypothetical protein
MKLVEGWTGNLPMRLLVEIANADGIRQQLIQS